MRPVVGSSVEQLRSSFTGTYTLERELGRGGMAVVFLATDTKHQRPVALKVLHPELARAVGAERFLREIEIAARLTHPHILPIFDSGRAGELLYYVMPYIRGESLRGRLERERQLPVADALRIAAEIADALACAHAAGIVHRDIKPENILLSGEHAVVADFGIARALSEAGGEPLTQTGLVVGTPAYMSPEQGGGETCDARSDIYSLGAVLYEMLAGEPPFTGATAQAVVARRRSEPAPPLRTVRDSVPAHLEQVVLRALARVPADRFETAVEFARALGVSAPEPDLVGGRPAARPPSNAVLPFVNRSSDPENEYFSDGLSEELINALAQIDGLQVASRTSAFAFKGKSDDIRRIGERLNVQTVLEGSVRKAANRLRIAVELVNTENGYTLWSEIYDREMADVFAVQDEIVLAIVTQLKVELVDAPAARKTRAVRSLEAYHQFLKGRYCWNKRTSEAMLHAIEYYERAIAIDDAYPEAYAGLGAAYATSGHFEHGVHRPREAMPRAKEAALRAQRLDPTLVEAVNVLAFERIFYEWDWRAAEEGFKQAIKIDDRAATVYHWYAMLLVALERTDEAIATVEHAVALEPLSFPTLWGAAWVYHYAGRFEPAIEQCRKVIEMEPYYLKARLQLGQSLSALGRHDEAIRELERAAAIAVRDPRSLMPLGHAYGAAGERDSATAILGELDEQARKSYVFPNYFASVYAGLNERDEAFKWLERAVDDRDGRLVMLKVDPMFAGLRDDPRYAGLLHKVGFRSS